MSEVAKLYKNAGVKKQIPKVCSSNELYCKECEAHIEDATPYCKNAEYPPFTPEKQLSLIKFILNKYGDIGFQTMYMITGNDESTRKDFIKCLCDCEHETWDSRPVDFYYQKGASGDNFEESLAGLINTLWQDLTEQERKEIRSILNG
ncbi:MAG: hypothetical protein K6E29_04180 [Cyanobacteria bacterium RUI128]|nr:hypothetical protein [Cyanobacteria bacterium RUI128]